ncbi:MAG TPA: alkaline phosphatase family protein, partial [Actinomycetota bacterium]|nr:alkaline phosphatase family protein [Actinomycetota bacterium]
MATAGQADQPTVKHVLLISVDGLHASDVAQCEADNLCPTIAWLSGNGTTYTHAMTSEPSDSSPGLMALMTGAL